MLRTFSLTLHKVGECQLNATYNYKKIHLRTNKYFSSSIYDNQKTSYRQFNYQDDLKNDPSRSNFIHPLPFNLKKYENLSENEQICFTDIEETNKLLCHQLLSLRKIIFEHSHRLIRLQPFYRPFITYTDGIIDNLLSEYEKNIMINPISINNSKPKFIFHIKDFMLNHIDVPYTRGSLCYKNDIGIKTHRVNSFNNY